MLNSAQWLNTPEWTKRLTPVQPHALTKVRQLYLALYEAITSGELAAQQQLPSSRQLATQLGLGRNTVIAVYAQLHDEGLIESSGRRGTRVCYTRADHAMRQATTARNANKKDRSIAPPLPGLSNRCSTGVRQVDGTSLPIPLVSAKARHADLAPGEPDASLFPSDIWRKALSSASKLPATNLGYRHRPLPQLQSALVRYLAIYRSLMVEPEQIIITSGTRQSLTLATALYADIGDHAWVESPGYRGAVDAFTLQGLQLRAMPVDDEGGNLDVCAASSVPALIYLTPCFQYPTGAPLSASRREQLLNYAHTHACMIFEDDYDSEFRDNSQARPALASQQAPGANNVLHAGTFSKLIFPAARIGWLVVPTQHIDTAHRCLRTLGGGHTSIAQAAVAEVINNGALAKHLQRARSLYTQRREVLLQTLEATGLFQSLPDTGGSLSLVAPLKRACSTRKLEAALDEQQLGALCLQDLQWDKPPARHTRALVLGLGNVSSLNIPGAVKRLSNAIQHAS